MLNTAPPPAAVGVPTTGSAKAAPRIPTALLVATNGRAARLGHFTACCDGIRPGRAIWMAATAQAGASDAAAVNSVELAGNAERHPLVEPTKWTRLFFRRSLSRTVVFLGVTAAARRKAFSPGADRSRMAQVAGRTDNNSCWRRRLRLRSARTFSGRRATSCLFQPTDSADSTVPLLRCRRCAPACDYGGAMNSEPPGDLQMSLPTTNKD